jgi:hypothetical protein
MEVVTMNGVLWLPGDKGLIFNESLSFHGYDLNISFEYIKLGYQGAPI